MKRNELQRGFTLLEVLVALTISGLALGGLFAVIAGNKRLAWNSEDVLLHATQARSLINLAQLDDTRGELPPALDLPDLELEAGLELDTPERKTQASALALRGFEVRAANGERVASGTYWVELDLSE